MLSIDLRIPEVYNKNHRFIWQFSKSQLKSTVTLMIWAIGCVFWGMIVLKASWTHGPSALSCLKYICWTKPTHMINQIFHSHFPPYFPAKSVLEDPLCWFTFPFPAVYKDTGGGNETVGFNILLSRCHLFSSCNISWQPYLILQVWGLLETIWQNYFPYGIKCWKRLWESKWCNKKWDS